jgi:hypothetical protein
VHCDRVWVEGEDRIVVAARALPDWQVTNFRRTAVVFREETYYVAEILSKDPGRPAPQHDRGFRYRLTPWPETLKERPARTIVYNSAEVERREREHRSVIVRGFESVSVMSLCVPIYPLLGLLPSPIKTAIENRFYISALTTTRWSLRIEYWLGLLSAVAGFASVIAPVPVHPGPIWLAPVLSVTCLADYFARWDRVNERERVHYGFLEWLVHRL